MATLNKLLEVFSSQLAAWRNTSLEDLQFWQRDFAWLAGILFISLVTSLAVFRIVIHRPATRSRVALPAILQHKRRLSFSVVRHTPALLLLLGIPFLLLALADPYTSVLQERTTFPGRRIFLMIDASTSMVRHFESPTLLAGNKGTSEATFFTTVAAAERFVRLRMDGEYRDLMSLVEFGDQAYVVTPFTSDYDNILLSLALIGDFGEFLRFPDQGTILTRAVEQGVQLFRMFDFLDASGNLIVMFTDGEDAGVIRQGKTVLQVVQEAVEAEVPIYFIRANFNRALGSVVPDSTWKAAVEKTGGKFYAASNEQTILRAINDIDRLASGKIEITQYVTQEPYFGLFAFITAALWSMALMLKLTVAQFQRFP